MNDDFLDISSENEIVSVSLGDIPDIITSSIDNISKLEEQVRNAEQSASKAMDYIGGQMTRYEEKGVWKFKYRSGNTTDIIEDTQEAVEKIAIAQQVSVDALKKSFEFQKKLAETSKYLFDLGCGNITVNRIAVRAIQLKLSGASKEELSDLAKQEMMAVVKQLKEQEDILIKQEFLTSKVKEQDSRLEEHRNRLKSKDLVDEKQESLIAENRKLIEKNSDAIRVLTDDINRLKIIDKERLDKIESLNTEHKDHHNIISEIQSSLSTQTFRLEDLTVLLRNKDLIDEKQESSIAENRKLIEKNSEAIKTLTEYKEKDILDKEQSQEISLSQNVSQRKLCIVAIILSSISLVCCITNLFLFLSKN